MPENSSCSSAGSCTKSSCEGCPSHNGGPQSFLVEQNKFSNIKHVIGVVSGKGGVGKSFVTSSLAVNMAKKGYKGGILDADITGPSIPKMFGAHDQILGDENGLMHPYETKEGIKLISVNLLMDNEEDPVIWRGPVIAGVVKQFWNETAWGDIDYLFVDMPPGTGDVPLTVFQSLPVDGIVIVTSPQELVNMIVKKAYNMAEAMHITVLGVVENFSYLIAMAIVFIVEIISRRSFISACKFVDAHTLAFMYNSFLVFVSFSLVYLFRRRAFARVIITGFGLSSESSTAVCFQTVSHRLVILI